MPVKHQPQSSIPQYILGAIGKRIVGGVFKAHNEDMWYEVKGVCAEPTEDGRWIWWIQAKYANGTFADITQPWRDDDAVLSLPSTGPLTVSAGQQLAIDHTLMTADNKVNGSRLIASLVIALFCLLMIAVNEDGLPVVFGWLSLIAAVAYMILTLIAAVPMWKDIRKHARKLTSIQPAPVLRPALQDAADGEDSLPPAWTGEAPNGDAVHPEPQEPTQPPRARRQDPVPDDDHEDEFDLGRRVTQEPYSAEVEISTTPTYGALDDVTIVAQPTAPATQYAAVSDNADPHVDKFPVYGHYSAAPQAPQPEVHERPAEQPVDSLRDLIPDLPNLDVPIHAHVADTSTTTSSSSTD